MITLLKKDLLTKHIIANIVVQLIIQEEMGWYMLN